VRQTSAAESAAPSGQVAARPGPDRCPGVLELHQAADGGLARVRIPGGRLTGVQWRGLVQLAISLADGNLHLTSRGNVQLRAVRAGAETDLSEGLFDLDLFPSASHERVSNIVASPMSGLDEFTVLDVSPLVGELAAQLGARPDLSQLSGRFLFGLDDGRGDIGTLGADICARAVDATTLALLLAGADTGIRCRIGEIAPAMLDAAQDFLAQRAEQDPSAWRIADLQIPVQPSSISLPGAIPRPGTVTQPDGRVAVVVMPPLGLITPSQAAVLDQAHLILTPWRTIVLPDLEPDQAAERVAAIARSGTVTDPSSGWRGVSACAGKPGCAQALADVRADARAVHASAVHAAALDAAAESPVVTTGKPSAVHWVGCERRCGLPAGVVATVLATGVGYRVSRGAHSLDVGAGRQAVSDALAQLTRKP
jgi:precorrin-3B synthase